MGGEPIMHGRYRNDEDRAFPLLPPRSYIAVMVSSGFALMGLASADRQ
jgi:hypothetical protein